MMVWLLIWVLQKRIPRYLCWSMMRTCDHVEEESKAAVAMAADVYWEAEEWVFGKRLRMSPVEYVADEGALGMLGR